MNAATEIEDELGSDFLHHAVDCRRWDVVRARLVHGSKEAARLVKCRHHDEECSLLDRACREHAPQDILASIHALDPYQVRDVNARSDCSTPLHTACLFAARDAVSFLLDAAPELTDITDRCGRIPLFDAVGCSRPQPDLVHALLSVHPTAVYATDDRGETPTRRFLRERTSPWHRHDGGSEVLSSLLRAHAHGTDYNNTTTDTANDKRNNTLHELLRRQDLPRCVPLQYCRGARAALLEGTRRDDEGNFALHLAARYRSGRGGALIDSVSASF